MALRRSEQTSSPSAHRLYESTVLSHFATDHAAAEEAAEWLYMAQITALEGCSKQTCFKKAWQGKFNHKKKVPHVQQSRNLPP